MHAAPICIWLIFFGVYISKTYVTWLSGRLDSFSHSYFSALESELEYEWKSIWNMKAVSLFCIKKEMASIKAKLLPQNSASLCLTPPARQAARHLRSPTVLGLPSNSRPWVPVPLVRADVASWEVQRPEASSHQTRQQRAAQFWLRCIKSRRRFQRVAALPC